MKTIIIGYGKMGREIEKILLERGHTISHIIDANNRADLNSETLKGVDVAIEFTTPDTAYENIRTCIENKIPVVSGTTGWMDRLEELQQLCHQRGSALFYASNYCLGVNLMFRLNEQLAQLVNRVGGDYTVELEEVHHIHKLDSPSGTSITIAEGIINNLDQKSGWVNHTPAPEDMVGIRSLREGEVAGIHTVTYDSADDNLQITHTIKNRKTLALGAVVAAEFINGKTGVFSMNDLLK